MEGRLQPHPASLLLGLPTTRTCHPAGHRAAATHASRHAVVSLSPVQIPGQARTAYRNDPDFNVQGINRPAAPSEGVKIGRVIENDQTVSENFQRLIYDTMAGVTVHDNFS